MVRVEWNDDVIINRLRAKAAAAVDTVVPAVRDIGEAIARKRTGAYAASMYTVTPSGSDYAERIAEASGKNSAVRFVPPEQVTQTPDAVRGGTGPAVTYGAVLEYGLESGRAGDATMATAASGAQQALAEALRD